MWHPNHAERRKKKKKLSHKGGSLWCLEALLLKALDWRLINGGSCIFMCGLVLAEVAGCSMSV